MADGKEQKVELRDGQQQGLAYQRGEAHQKQRESLIRTRDSAAQFPLSTGAEETGVTLNLDLFLILREFSH